jgi:hypothetical protein
VDELRLRNPSCPKKSVCSFLFLSSSLIFTFISLAKTSVTAVDPVKEILAKKKVESKALPSAPSSKTPATLVAKLVQLVPAAASEDRPKPRPRPRQKTPPPVVSSSRLSPKSPSLLPCTNILYPPTRVSPPPIPRPLHPQQRQATPGPSNSCAPLRSPILSPSPRFSSAERRLIAIPSPRRFLDPATVNFPFGHLSSANLVLLETVYLEERHANRMRIEMHRNHRNFILRRLQQIRHALGCDEFSEDDDDDGTPELMSA